MTSLGLDIHISACPKTVLGEGGFEKDNPAHLPLLSCSIKGRQTCTSLKTGVEGP